MQVFCGVYILEIASNILSHHYQNTLLGNVQVYGSTLADCKDVRQDIKDRIFKLAADYGISPNTILAMDMNSLGF